MEGVSNREGTDFIKKKNREGTEKKTEQEAGAAAV
jgi:hypothetical protein